MFGDHGARFSKVRTTVQGKLEERLPLMSFAFPKLFKENYPHLMRNLNNNANRSDAVQLSYLYLIWVVNI